MFMGGRRQVQMSLDVKKAEILKLDEKARQRHLVLYNIIVYYIIL